MTTQPTSPAPVPFYRSVIPKDRIDSFTYNAEAIEPQPNAIFANRADAIAFLTAQEKQRLQNVDAIVINGTSQTVVNTWNVVNLDGGHVLLEGLK